MTRFRLSLTTLVPAAAISLCSIVAAQTPPPAPRSPDAAQPAPPAVPAEPAPPEAPADDDRGDSRREVVRIGQDYTLRAGDTAREVVVIMGNATIAGQVEREVVVVLGTATLERTAVIGRSLVVVGGGVTIEPGAVVERDLVVVAGSSNEPAGFSPGGEHIVIGPGLLGIQVEWFLPWFTRGLLWGRPLVPDLPWIWAIVGVFFLVYLALNQLADVPVGASAAALIDKPLTAFGAGLLVLLLVGPVCMLLAVSVVGLVVVPFVLCAVLVAWIVGKVGVMRWIGMHLLRDRDADTPLRALRAFAAGFVVITVAYLIPVLGMVAWAIAGVLGLGAATLALLAAYRREQPPAAAAAPPPPLPGAVPAAPVLQYAGVPPPAEPAPVASAPATAAPAVPLQELATFPRAPFRDRLAAFVLDVILMLIAVQLVDADAPARLFFLGLLAYHIGFWTWRQTTVGGIICQLRLVRVDGGPLTFADALVRGLSSIFSLAVLGLGVLWILRDPERQAWHDKIAGTYVVKVPRDWPR